MKADVKQVWLDALRSGEYEQCRQVLRGASGSYCCLGVLCEISKAGQWIGNYPMMYEAGEDFGDGEPPACLRRELGIARYEIETLIDLNDTLKRDFREIADWIEENL